MINTIALSRDLEYNNKHLDKENTKDIAAYVMIRYQSLKLESKKDSLFKELDDLSLLLSLNKQKDKKKLLSAIRSSKNAVELLDLIEKEFKNYI